MDSPVVSEATDSLVVRARPRTASWWQDYFKPFRCREQLANKANRKNGKDFVVYPRIVLADTPT